MRRLRSSCRIRGSSVEQADSGEEALRRLSEFAFDILITDLRLPGIDGRQVLDAALERYPDIVAIVITGYGTVKDAVDAIKQGAADFITKPFQFDALLHVLSSAMEQRRLKSENAYLRSQLQERYRIDGLVGRSQVMRDLFQLLEIVAATSSTVLITGETGTGKELAAKAIHHNSARRAQRFLAINCSAIPETLLEAELFGHVRGAFTGRDRQPPGTLRAGAQGHALPRRSGDHEPGAAGQAAACHSGARVRTRRRLAHDQDRRPRHRRHALGSRQDGGRGSVSRGSLLPVERDSGEAARTARTSRRHSAPRPALPAEAVGRARTRARRRCRRRVCGG